VCTITALRQANVVVVTEKPNFAPSPGYFLRRFEVGIADKSWFLLR